MQAGSLVKCIKPFSAGVKAAIMIAYKVSTPELNHDYLVEAVERCRCGQHDNVILDYCDVPWPVDHFREIEPPIEINIDELMTETIEA